MRATIQPLPWVVLTALAALALVWLSASDSTLATNYPVTTTIDSADGVCDGHCSLREAVIAANASPLVPDTISLPAGTYVIGGARGDDTAGTGDLDVTCTSVGCSTSAPLTINGAGPGLTIIDAGGSDRVFDLATAQSNITTLNLNNLTVRNGNPGTANGGAIRVGNSDTVNLTNVVIADSVSGVSGGGLSSSGNLTLTNSTVSENSAANGGGILNGSPGSLTINSSTVSGNYAGGSGGGGLDNKYTASLTNVTVSDNFTSGPGGGILHSGLGSPSITLTNVTLGGNSGASGSGIRHDDPATLRNAVLANNAATNCTGAVPLTNNGGNLDTGSTCGFALSGVDPLLGPLQNNGGLTATRELMAGSPAINAATACPPPSTDQRGAARPQGPACDIGAFEYGAAAPTPTPAPSPTPPPNSDNDADGWTYANENLIGTDPADPCGGDAWPADLVSEGTSLNKLDLADLTSFIAPLRRLGTSPGHPNFDPRYDLVPGAAFGAYINVSDMASLISGATGYPPMFAGARAFGQTCIP